MIKTIDVSNNIVESFYRIFNNSDANELHLNVIDKNLYSMMLLFYTEDCFINRVQYEALSKTITSVGENSFYVIPSSWSGTFPRAIDDVGFGLANYPQYYEIVLPESYEGLMQKLQIETNTYIFSLSEKWGIVVGEDNFGLLGIKEELLERFKKNYPNWQEDRQGFQETYRELALTRKIDYKYFDDVLKYTD